MPNVHFLQIHRCASRPCPSIHFTFSVFRHPFKQKNSWLVCSVCWCWLSPELCEPRHSKMRRKPLFTAVGAVVLLSFGFLALDAVLSPSDPSAAATSFQSASLSHPSSSSAASDDPAENDQIHVLFSSSCDSYSHWQVRWREPATNLHSECSVCFAEFVPGRRCLTSLFSLPPPRHHRHAHHRHPTGPGSGPFSPALGAARPHHPPAELRPQGPGVQPVPHGLRQLAPPGRRHAHPGAPMGQVGPVGAP